MRTTSLLIILFYSFPFVYFAMYQDFMNQSMLGYLLILIAAPFLAVLSIRFSHRLTFIIGNSISTLTSFYFIHQMTEKVQWGYYFTPLTVHQLFIVVSLLNVILQIITIKVAKYRKEGGS
ncbi:hypothetical protein [Lysinibacillus piscis]|uniref:Uncharacterized protein n=1 Tax=Lysinibacillus piscis TaxID=2518931 RepID=A0ABQ5NLJ6_9BACI|nr:hypothetical protein [Lysinibacillus sp. KH24]GLC89220.1 hypothetical protein LYSBPC_23470 [Lysinibacillus sp. KH24]